MPVNPNEGGLAVSPPYRGVVYLSFPMKEVWFVCFSPKEEFMTSLPVSINEGRCGLCVSVVIMEACQSE